MSTITPEDFIDASESPSVVPTPEGFPQVNLSREQVEAFIAQVKAAEHNGDHAEAQRLARQFSDKHLAYSPSDIVMDTRSMYDLLSSARDSEALMPTLAANLIGELGYEAGFADGEWFRALAERVKQESPEQGIISMLMYRDVLSDAASVTSDMGRHAAMGFGDVFDDVLDDPDLPVFSKIIARAGRQSIEDIVRDPERGVVQLSNDPRNGKFSTSSELHRVKDATAELDGKFQSPADGNFTFLVRLSSDRVGVVDHAGVPLMVAPLDRTREQEQKPVPGLDRRLLSDLASIGRASLQDLYPEALLTKMNFWRGKSETLRAGLAPSALVEGAPKGFDDAVARSTAILDEVNSMRREQEAEMRRETGERALQATREVCGAALADENIRRVIDAHWASDLQEAQSAIRQNDEYGYELLLGLIERAERIALSPEEQRAILLGHSKKSYIASLQERHAEIHREAAEQSVDIEVTDEITHAYDTLNLYLEKLEQQWPSVQKKILGLRSELKGQMGTLDFTDVDVSGIQNPAMFRAIHEAYVSNEFAHEFGFSLSELSISAQQQAIAYMLSRKEDEFSRLKHVLEGQASDNRVQLFETFVATEFGDDLGGQILALAERGEQNNQFLDQLSRVGAILESIRRFTVDGTVAQVDKRLADDIRRGISTRTAEILYALNQRLDKNKPTGKVEMALAKLDEWSRGVAMMLERGVPQKVQVAENTTLYQFMNPDTGKKYAGTLELTTNGKFAEEATQRERYIKEGRGARISLTYDESQPEAALSLNGTVRRRAMNGRLDKSVYNIGTDQSEPDAERAEVSFDIASIHADKQSESRITAEVIGEGSAIRDTGHGNKGGAKNFTYDIIDQDWGQRERFADTVRTFGDMLDARARRARGQKLASFALQGTDARTA